MVNLTCWNKKIRSEFSKYCPELERVDDSDTLLYWYNSNFTKNKQRYGVYFEIYYRKSTNSVFLAGLKYSSGGVSVYCDAKKFFSTWVEISESRKFSIVINDSIHYFADVLFSIDVLLSFNKFTRFFCVHEISLEYTYSRSWEKIEPEIIRQKIPLRSGIKNMYNFIFRNELYKNSKIIDLLCYRCMGCGSTYQFSIPRSENTSDLTGYDRYSANAVNGEYGCEHCGGSGVIYKDWYLLENKSLSKQNLSLVKGSGFLREKLMNSIIKIE